MDGEYTTFWEVFIPNRWAPFKSFFWSQLAGLISALLLIFVFTISLNVPILVIVLIPIAAICYSAGYLFFFKGFEIGNVSIVAATMNLWAVFTMLFAFIFMGQRLSTIQSLGRLNDYLRRYFGIYELERYWKSRISTFIRRQGNGFRGFFLWCLLEH